MNRQLYIFGDMDLLHVIGLGKRLQTPGNRAYALSAISFSQKSGQRLALTGSTGSGKSSLLKLIAGLLQPDEGTILFEGKPVAGPAETLVPGHPGISYLSQHFELRSNYRVGEVLSYANEMPAEEAATLYEVCRIDHLMHRKTDQLSGGERQRVALARLLVRPTRLLLLDEPYSNLDRVHRELLQAVVDDVLGRYRMSCILISHDPSDILPWADQILVLREGELIQMATPERIYRQPADEYVAGLFGKYNRIHSSLAARLGRLPGSGEGRDLLVRPEKLTLSAVGRTAAQGIVARIDFMGGYYEVEVDLAGCRLLVRVDTNAYQEGQVVFVGMTA
ncbi:MAG TPA: ABC transporter ATP-binding protein, partial [Puia sp.]|nr:ABC transporter ATP-binding protein [Puia sp.]